MHAANVTPPHPRSKYRLSPPPIKFVCVPFSRGELVLTPDTTHTVAHCPAEEVIPDQVLPGNHLFCFKQVIIFEIIFD